MQDGYESSNTYRENENSHGSSTKKFKKVDARSSDDHENGEQVSQLIAENNDLREDIVLLKEKLMNAVSNTLIIDTDRKTIPVEDHERQIAEIQT